tara:strand:+ start:1766 stop:2341 length:576 start_codon:yes stop_codon:yes gene_type:complete
MGLFNKDDTDQKTPTKPLGDESTQEKKIETPVETKETKVDKSAPVFNTDPELLKRLEAQEATIQMLMGAADRHKIQRIKEQSGHGNGPKVIKIRLYEEKNKKGEFVKQVIVGWRMIKNYVTAKTAYDNNTQITEITLEDGTSREMTFYDFSITYDEKAEVVVDKITDVQGEKFYSFTYEGKEIELAEKFIN